MGSVDRIEAGADAAVKMATMRVEKPWGRTSLPPPFGEAGAILREPIGEIWFEVPGRELELMIKYIFTSEKLSIQVHPSDEQARGWGHRQGKEECWYILDAEPGAAVGIGTLEPLEPGRLADACRSGAIERMMDWIPVRPGDFFYIPAGTVHAIGAGIALVEIQQNADITYRLYDYGRPRELHLERGIAVSAARPYPQAMRRHVDIEAPGLLVDGPKFSLALAHGAVPELAGEGPYYIVPLTGAVEFGGRNFAAERAAAGECLLTDDPASVAVLAGGHLFVARSCGTGASR